jgi:hypothetical protein
MPDEQLLRAVIVNIFERLKVAEKDSLALSNELAALRNAVQELSGGKFQPLLEKHRKLLEEKEAAAGVIDLSDYDEIIRRVKAGELF